MPRVYLTSSLREAKTPEQLASRLQAILNDMQDQMNSGPAIHSLLSVKDELPKGARPGDIVFDISSGSLVVGMFNGKTIIN